MSPESEPGPVATATADLLTWLAEQAGVVAILAAPAAAPADPAPPRGDRKSPGSGSADPAPARGGPKSPGSGSADPAPARGGPKSPGSDAAAPIPQLSVWPLELRPDQQWRHAGPLAPLRLRVRYLLAPDGAGLDALRLLDRVLVAATRSGEPTVVLEPPSPQTWLALGVPPRAALLLDKSVEVTRPTPEVPTVQRPLRLRDVPLRPLRGLVLGPNDTPLTGMRVEVAATGQSAYTDTRGRFAFAAVPAQAARLQLRGRGRTLLAEIESTSAEPVVIHCDFEES